MKFEFKSKFNNFIYLLLTLLFVCTAVNVGLNFADSGDSDLSNIAVAADQPTNINYYWTDTEAQTEQGVDFTNYTLSGSSSKTDPYLIQSETDLAFLSWTIYTGNAYNNHVSGSYYYSDVYFKQTKNLDLSAYYWQPIGINFTRGGTSAARYFLGNYDGGGHTVSGVFTPAGSSNGYSYQGLFGRVYSGSSTQQASIANLGVIDSFIRGYQYVGGVVGYASSSTVSNVYNTGSVSGTGNYVGGVVGYAGSYATISNAYNTGSVSGSSDVGGVVGYASSSSATVSNVYNTGTVSGSSYVGGVVGYAYSDATISNAYNTGSVRGSSYVGGVVGGMNAATVRNVYNTGSVSGDSRVGGVVGYVTSTGNNSTITNVYNIGLVSGTGNYVGGVVGYTTNRSDITNTYYGGDCTLDVGIGDGEGSAIKIDSPVEEWAKNEEWYRVDATGEDGALVWNVTNVWDFDFTWDIDSEQNDGYPVLRTNQNRPEKHYWIDEYVQTEQGVDFTNYTLSGSGSSEGDPYLIQSETDLAFLSWTIYNDQVYGGSSNKVVSGGNNYFYSDVCFKQTKNLDLSAYHWQPIGIYYTRDVLQISRCFSGNYDGGGYTVSGVFTPAGSGYAYSYQGLFGYVYGRSSTQQASIANLGVIDSFVQGNNYVGGVVGEATYATITNVYNTGSVSGNEGVGGVVGYAYSSVTVSNVYNTGSVSGSSRVGGIVGYESSGSTVSNVYNSGLVTGDSTVGGVVGYARVSSSTISNAYNTGSVSGNEGVGGVVGIADATVSNVYNTGSVSGSSNVGGVAGRVSSSATITNTYYGGDCTLDVGIGSGSGSATKIDSPVEEWVKNEEWYSADATLEDGTLIWDSAYPWDFENTWEFSLSPDYMLGYPTLQGMSLIISAETIFWTDSEVQTEFGVDFTNYTLSGSGSEEDPYLIQSETDLAFLSWTIYNDQVYGGSDNKYTSGINNYFYSDVCFKQTKNLDLSAYYWQPIGISYTRDGTSADRYFSGNYDGGGYTVSGVFTPAGSGDAYSYQGLFGFIRGRSSTQRASIANVGVIDSFVQGYDYIGGVVGEAWFYVDITNIYNTGRVSGEENVAGIAGESSFSANIINAYNTGSVSGSSYVGGLVGMSTSITTITNAYNTGLISGTGNYVGGVVGYADYNATVSNVYNTGIVSGSSDVGGVVGRASDSATISNCGVECAVITGTSNVGIFVGQNASSSATIENCYAIVDGDLSPYGSNFGTVTNCLWIAGGVKYYLGTDFSGFAWLNTDSCPIPKGLSWMGQFWTEDITSQITSSSDWTEWVA